MTGAERAPRPATTARRAVTVPATTTRRAVEGVWRMESARIVGALARYTRDFALAEDVAQEALAEALVGWATAGIHGS